MAYVLNQTSRSHIENGNNWKLDSVFSEDLSKLCHYPGSLRNVFYNDKFVLNLTDIWLDFNPMEWTYSNMDIMKSTRLREQFFPIILIRSFVIHQIMDITLNINYAKQQCTPESINDNMITRLLHSYHEQELLLIKKMHWGKKNFVPTLRSL